MLTCEQLRVTVMIESFMLFYLFVRLAFSRLPRR
jgi:hypothetical protein